MSAGGVSGAIDWRMSVGGSPTTEQFSLTAHVQLDTDSNAANPILMLQGGGQLYGIYTDATGTDLVISGPGGYDASPVIGSLTVGAFHTVSLVGSAGNVWTPYFDGVAGSPWTPTMQGPFTIDTLWFTNDAYSYNDALLAYLLMTNTSMSAAQVLAAQHSTTPWDAVSIDNTIIRGSLVGATIDEVKATVGGGAGLLGAINWGTAVRSASDPTFGASLAGSTVLDIA